MKPDNIMLDKKRTPKIIDFGFAKAKEDRMNKSTKFEGTAAYAAPERINGEKSTPGSDVYSFGAIGFYVFFRENPANVKRTEMRFRLQDNTTLDIRFSFIGQCLEKEVKNRISSRTLAMLIHNKIGSKPVATQAPIPKSDSDKNARNVNGLTAMEVAVEEKDWDMVDWLLSRGFECKGVGKIVGNGDIYVGQVKNGKKHGHRKATMANGEVCKGEWMDDIPSDVTLLSTTLNNNIQQPSIDVQTEPRPPITNFVSMESLQKKNLLTWIREMLIRLLSCSPKSRPIWIRMPGMKMG